MRFATTAQGEPDQPDPSPGESASWKVALVLTAMIVVVSLIINVARPPQFDHSGDALRPQNSPAYATLDLIQDRMGHEQEPLWVIVQGESEEAVSRSLTELRKVLSTAKADGLIAGFTLPETLWPHAAFQRANASTAAWLADHLPEVRAAALGLGFSTNALNLTRHITETWDRFANTEGVFWPTNDTSQWTLGKLAVRHDNAFFCAGLIHPIEGDRTASLGAFVDAWPEEFTRNGILLSGWSLLGESVFDIVMKDLPRVLIPMTALILVTLWLAYRRVAEILLSLAMLAVAALTLSAVMALLGWQWNLMNLMAMPLLLGAGVDYTIHMQLALQRHAGNLREVRRSVGRALLVCGGTTTTAFGSLSFSSNAGLASLGQVCATGILVSTLIAVFLLPLWWQAATRSRRSG
jgi:predicted exporter